MTEHSTLNHALAYIASGWHVLPLRPLHPAPTDPEEFAKRNWSKEPFGKLAPHGANSATNDPEVARRWWTMHPDCGIGIACAQSGLAILDVDPRNRGDVSFDALEGQRGQITSDVHCFSGREGGFHLYFQNPERLPLKSPGAGIDMKVSGYVAAPPTLHAIGYPEGTAYEWEASSDPTEGCKPSPLPDWLAATQHASKSATSGASGAPMGEVLVVDPATVRDLRSALGQLRADDRDQWVAVGHALKELGEVGRGLWVEWSQTSEKFTPADVGKWDTFAPGHTGYQSVFAKAQRAGWVNPMASTSTAATTFPPLADDDVADHWPTPEPLPEGLPPVPAFDPDLMPQALRGWVADIAHRMQCPMDFPAVGAITALSSLIGARAVVAPKARDDWRVVPNLWGLIVGRPAVMKSPALAQTLGPLNRLQANELEIWKQAHADWELDCKVADMANDSNEKKAKGLASKDPAAARALLEPGETPAEPLARRFIVNDATVEKLGELLVANPWGTLSFRDELYGLLKSLDKEDQAAARAFMLQAYDGNQGYTFDRILRGTVHIPRVCVAMVGGIQPGRIQEYVRSAVSGGTGDDGLLQRFGLTVWPDIQREFAYIDQWPDTHQKQTAWAVYERLATLLPATDDDPVEWRFSPEAQGIFAEWMVEAKTELRGGELHPALVSHLDKYSKLVPALALIFALVDTPDSGNVIHEGELIRALAWAEYLRPHAERLYSAATTPETTGAAALLHKIKSGKLTDGDGVLLEAFSPRQLAVKSWAGLASVEAVRKAADLLVDYSWLVADVVRSGDALGRGRPSDRYRINPAVLKGGAQ